MHVIGFIFNQQHVGELNFFFFYWQKKKEKKDGLALGLIFHIEVLPFIRQCLGKSQKMFRKKFPI